MLIFHTLTEQHYHQFLLLESRDDDDGGHRADHKQQYPRETQDDLFSCKKRKDMDRPRVRGEWKDSDERPNPLSCCLVSVFAKVFLFISEISQSLS